jgi:hypothetical protein
MRLQEKLRNGDIWIFTTEGDENGLPDTNITVLSPPKETVFTLNYTDLYILSTMFACVNKRVNGD